MATEQQFDATTEKGGGYTIKVPPGRYRMEVELRGGDQLAQQPEQTRVNVDAQMNFVIGR